MRRRRPLVYDPPGENVDSTASHYHRIVQHARGWPASTVTAPASAVAEGSGGETAGDKRNQGVAASALQRLRGFALQGAAIRVLKEAGVAQRQTLATSEARTHQGLVAVSTEWR